MPGPMHVIKINKSRMAEVSRQTAAECVDDIRRCLAERNYLLDGDLRHLFLDTIHTKMLLCMLDELSTANYDFQEG
jgi:hypothetical protein